MAHCIFDVGLACAVLGRRLTGQATRLVLRTVRLMNDEAIIVFARVPRLGEVKSRLAARAGQQQALDIYRQMLRRVLGQVAAVEYGLRELCIFGDDAEGECAALAQEFSLSLAVQVGDDLGERMYRRLLHHTRQGRRSVLIGSDCPWLQSTHLRQALELLKNHDQVFAPALDGGYVLVGSRSARPEVFQGIDWGSSRVMSQTQDQLRRIGASVGLLAHFRDVDDWDDWLAWLSDNKKAESPGSGAKLRCGD